MASTYSNLKVQLMATGENNTTWGDVTNINLGTALEEAIVGSEDVAFSNASVTLTLTNTNASQAARNVRLNLTGTATSGYNLVVPAIEKPYIINNGTDGTITVKNSTGTGIAVPAGKTMWVYNNGTNVVDVVTHLTSLTVTGSLTAGNVAAAANLTAVNTTTTNLTATTANVTNIAVAANLTTANATATNLTATNISSSGLNANNSVNDTGTIATTSPGLRGLPQNAQTASYTLALTDAGKHISITTGGIVIPANSSVAFPVGTAIALYNNSGSSQTISITSDTLRQAGTSSTGSRTLGQYGLATCVKVASTTWVVSGAGIS